MLSPHESVTTFAVLVPPRLFPVKSHSHTSVRFPEKHGRLRTLPLAYGVTHGKFTIMNDP